jgi:hypothetical protein
MENFPSTVAMNLDLLKSGMLILGEFFPLVNGFWEEFSKFSRKGAPRRSGLRVRVPCPLSVSIMRYFSLGIWPSASTLSTLTLASAFHI